MLSPRVLLIWVIPVFAEVFSSFGAGAAGADAVRHQPLELHHRLLLVPAWRSRSSPPSRSATPTRPTQGRCAIDRFLLQVPIFGELIRKSSIARFTRTLGTLVSSGVPILDALTITARTAGNKVVERAIMHDARQHREGRTIAEPLIESKVFPPMVCQMIAVGETTGALDAMLQKIADFYEDEVDNTVANLTSLMEPLVILFLGVVIGGLVISMYLPIFKLGSVMD